MVDTVWRITTKSLPANFKIAPSRLHSTYSTAMKEDYLDTYNDVIVDQLRRGIIEVVKEPFKSEGHITLHYIPHFAVISPEKSTKCRVVYDAACKPTKSTPCLTDLIYKGPSLLPGLVDILLRFRMPKIALISDLEKAFLMISLYKADRDSVRFLWIKDINLPPTYDNIATYRFARIAFGVVASPFILAATIQHHLRQQKTPLADKLIDNTCVDNIFLSAHNDEKAIHRYHESKELFKRAAMNARKYISNSRKTNDSIAPCDLIKNAESGVVKFLGLK